MGWQICSTGVAIVASPAQDAESQGLEHFLVERGLHATRVPGLPTPAALREVRDSIVLFTKGFDVDAARAWLERLLEHETSRLVIVVSTSLPAFADLGAKPDTPLLLLAAPVLAWQLVDLIRNHLAAKPAAPG